MEKCVIYSRVSSDHQDYSRQINELRVYAKSKDLSIVDEFNEKKSASKYKKTDRVEYFKMKEYVIMNNIKRILMWEISRLSRDTIMSLTEIRDFKNNNIGIYFLQNGLDTLDENNMLAITILSSISEKENELRTSRIKSGKRNKARENNSITGFWTIPYGYKNVNSKLAIDEEEANVIKMIYQFALEGTGFRGIARELNSRGIKTRWTKKGKRIFVNSKGVIEPTVWKPNSISLILKNTLYKGERKYKGETKPIPAPIIIPKEEWERVRDVISKRPGIRKRQTSYNYLLQGKIICGDCTRHYGARTETRYGYEDSFYYCNGARDLKKRCKNGQVSSRFLEEGIYLTMFAHMDRMLKLKEEQKTTFNLQEKLNQIEFYTKERNENVRELEKLAYLFRKSDMTSKEYELNKRIINVKDDNLKFQIKSINNEIDQFNSISPDKLSVKYFMTDDPNMKQSFIDKYLDKIIIHKIKEVAITEKQIKSKNIEFITLWEDPLNETREWFKKEVLYKKTKSRLIFVELYAFSNTEPLNIILVKHLRKPLPKMNHMFVVPTLSINSGVLSIKN